jgi:pimeloyl-ACP methyl ester carboxylesterase
MTVGELREPARPVPATAADEAPVYLASGDEHISGVYTQPNSPSADLGVILLHAGYMNMSANRNRLWVRLARRLSADGCHVLRLDFHGTGDSSGILTDRASVQALDDVLAGVDLLRQLGARRFILVGSCYGAQVGLRAASEIPDLVALCMLSPPLQRMRKRPSGALPQQRVSAKRVTQLLRFRVWSLYLRDASYRAWLTKRVTRRLRGAPVPRRAIVEKPAERRLIVQVGQPTAIVHAVAARGIPLHVLYGTSDPTYNEIVAAGDESVLNIIGSDLDLHVVTEPVHGLTSLAAQRTVTDFVAACVRGLISSPT